MPPTRLLTLLAALVVIATACGKEEADCSCFNPGLTVAAPRGELVSIDASGAACSGVKIRCTDPSSVADAFVPGCGHYIVTPDAEGDCVLHITTRTMGVFDETRAIEDDTKQSCCGAFDVVPSSASAVVIPGG